MLGLLVDQAVPATTQTPPPAQDDVTEPIGEGEDVFDAYCREMESTAAWGGHLELEALSQSLRLPITVHAAAAKPQQLGSGFQGARRVLDVQLLDLSSRAGPSAAWTSDVDRRGKICCQAQHGRAAWALPSRQRRRSGMRNHPLCYPAGPALDICYFQHAYGLGEHYNSTVALPKTEQPEADA